MTIEEISATSLSGRQIECLYWAAQGKTSNETAMILDLSVFTVNNHLREAAIRLNAANRTHAVAMALRLGMICVAVTLGSVAPMSDLCGTS
ncbi:helix-turn-helix domain-containing protein [Mangrovicella endophytica]|uniref:helix-turn-helix domain-containing protein n=1 Tax=Mangrovicella endophytica TaxID=2066697 RepID=UPI0012FFDB2C|nr:helix-turn-helix transcriptional regulator [Mangrovicella endophytica]